MLGTLLKALVLRLKIQDSPPTLDDCAQADKELFENLSEAQIDKMIEDSFPASDPPGTY